MVDGAAHYNLHALIRADVPRYGESAVSWQDAALAASGHDLLDLGLKLLHVLLQQQQLADQLALNWHLHPEMDIRELEV